MPKRLRRLAGPPGKPLARGPPRHGRPSATGCRTWGARCEPNFMPSGTGPRRRPSPIGRRNGSPPRRADPRRSGAVGTGFLRRSRGIERHTTGRPRSRRGNPLERHRKRPPRRPSAKAPNRRRRHRGKLRSPWLRSRKWPRKGRKPCGPSSNRPPRDARPSKNSPSAWRPRESGLSGTREETASHTSRTASG